jgi:protein SCO1/2
MIGRISFYIMITLANFACTVDSDVVENKTPIAITALPYYHTPNFDPIWEVGDLDTLHTISDFNFTNQNGLSITEKTVANKIYISNFFFTNCGGICPKLTRNMEKVQSAFEAEEDVLFLSHTVAPETDSVAKLKIYTNNFNINDSRWHFLTGSKGELYEMARQSYFAEEAPGFNKDSTQFLHTEHFILVDRNSHIRGIYNGTVELEMNRIIEDVNLLLTE